ncbi:protein E6-like [Salvia divinorum]|uniref:Protein E6-like n=1 Tax=Salvia divinorum TaxID=28513 RepID=A0ABD1HUV5_SALDI
MASPAMKLSIFLLLSLFSSLHTHARDSQFFNKIPSTTTNVAVPATTNNEVPTNQQDPTFLPDNENSYGLYGHESGQNPPSTAEFKQPPNKYLPKNYNPVAYVTQPESDLNDSPAAFSEERTFTTNPDNNNNNNNNNYYSGEQNYYNNQQQLEESEFRSYRTPTATNVYYNGGSSFNNQPQGQDDGAATFQPQGMSDTRFMENGKYFYDTNSEKYSSNHPYETLRGARPQNEFNNRNFYGKNAYEFNGDSSMGGYQNREDQFQDDENMP